MKRFLGMCFLCFAVVGVSASHSVWAHQDDDDDDDDSPRRVAVCHVVLSDTLSNGIMRFCGHVIRVPRRALNRHLAHGDVELESAEQTGRRCAFSVLPDGSVVPGLVD